MRLHALTKLTVRMWSRVLAVSMYISATASVRPSTERPCRLTICSELLDTRMLTVAVWFGYNHANYITTTTTTTTTIIIIITIHHHHHQQQLNITWVMSLLNSGDSRICRLGANGWPLLKQEPPSPSVAANKCAWGRHWGHRGRFWTNGALPPVPLPHVESLLRMNDGCGCTYRLYRNRKLGGHSSFQHGGWGGRVVRCRIAMPEVVSSNPMVGEK